MMGDRISLKLWFSSWQWLFLLLSIAIFAVNIVACSGGSSSNSPKTRDLETQAIECSDDFGDASRCETRGNLP